MLVIDGHPNAHSLSSALARAYCDGANGRLLALRDLRFDPILRDQELEPDLREARALLEASEHVAWFFPTWWAGPPALVKGFVERTFLPGWAYQHNGHSLHQRLLRGRSARVVTTMDAPWWWYSAIYTRALHAAFVNATLRFVGFSVSSTTLYGVRFRSRAWLSKRVDGMRALAERDLRAAPRRLARSPSHPRLAAPAADCTHPPSTPR